MSEKLTKLEKLIREKRRQDKYAQALVDLVINESEGQWASVYDSAIEVDTYSGCNGTELVIRLAALTEFQKVFAARFALSDKKEIKETMPCEVYAHDWILFSVPGGEMCKCKVCGYTLNGVAIAV